MSKITQNGLKWTKMDQNGPKWAKMGHKLPKWTNMTHYDNVLGLFLTILSLVLTILDGFGPFWTIWGQIGQIWTIFPQLHWSSY